MSRLREARYVLLAVALALLLPSGYLLSRTLPLSEHKTGPAKWHENRYKEDEYLRRQALLKLDELDGKMSEMEADLSFLKGWFDLP